MQKRWCLQMLKILKYMNPNFNEEIEKKVITWKEYVDKGHFGNSRDIINTYNIVFKDIKKPHQYTNCGSCLRRCCIEMYDALMKNKEEQLQALEVLDSLLTPTEEEIIETEAPKKKKTKEK